MNRNQAERLAEMSEPLMQWLEEQDRNLVAVVTPNGVMVRTDVVIASARRPVPQKYRTCCSRCGNVVDLRQNYCASCGSPVAKSEAVKSTGEM